MHLLSALVILCHSGRDEYSLLYGYFPEKLKILEGNWFFSSALSLHKCSGGKQNSLGDDLCFIVTVEPRHMHKPHRMKAQTLCMPNLSTALASVTVSTGKYQGDG